MAYEDAWDDYQRALEGLYEGTGAERSGRTVTADEGRVDAVIERSQALGDAAAEGLGSPEREVRELAELQLVTAAALDLMVAEDLVEADGSSDAERSGVAPPTELFAVLRTPQSAGIGAVLGAEERSDRSADAGADALSAAETALADIIEDAGKAGSALTKSLVAVPGLSLSEVGNVVAHELLDRLSDKLGAFVRKAVELVAKALDKLRKALGKDVSEAAEKEAKGWFERLAGGELMSALLRRLYEEGRIKEEVAASLKAGSRDEPALRELADRLDAHAQRFAKQCQALGWLARGLAAVRNWLLAFQPPIGPIALVSVHVAALGYVGYLGGEYVDWYRTDKLDFVPGIRQIVRS